MTILKTRHFLAAALSVMAAAPIQAQSWDGFYLGAFFGAGTGSYELADDPSDEVGPVVDVEDVIYGFRAGRRWQYGASVVGADLSTMTGPSGISPQVPRPPDGSAEDDVNCFSGDCNLAIGPVISARLSYGVAVAPQTLVYAAAGLATADIEGGIENSAQQGTSTAFGYTAALGFEQQIPNGLAVFGEAAYYDLGDLEFGDGVRSGTFEGDGDFATITIGVNLRF